MVSFSAVNNRDVAYVKWCQRGGYLDNIALSLRVEDACTNLNSIKDSLINSEKAIVKSLHEFVRRQTEVITKSSR